MMSKKLVNEMPIWHDKKALSCRLSSTRDVVDAVNLLSDEFWVFRGQLDSEWPLKTSLERKYGANRITSKEEINAIFEFMNKARMHLDFGCSLLDALAAMRHYGVATRMLDFTRSFFVALYFAFNGGGQTRTFRDHAIWAIRMNDAFLKSQGINYELEEEVRTTIDNVTRDNRLKGCDEEDIVQAGFSYLQDKLLDNSIFRAEKIRKIAEGILSGKNDENIVGILPIDVFGSNARMIAQNGLFVMTVDFSSFEDSLIRTLNIKELKSMPIVPIEKLNTALTETGEVVLLRFVVGEEIRNDVSNLLKAANIDNSTLFPDLSGIASQIEYKKVPNDMITNAPKYGVRDVT